MKAYNFDKMHSGWYIGDFFPSAMEWKGGEISVKHFPKNHIEVSYYHENATKYYVILKGELLLDGTLVKKGQVAVIEPKEDVTLVALQNSVVLLAVVGDRKFTRFNIQSLDRELSVYDSVFSHKSYDGEIDFADIDVVVQGAIEKDITPICMASIRKFLPGSRIILSTWEGSDIDGLDYDLLVLNKDPGGYRYKIKTINKEFTNNVNRQLVSIQNGLRKVNTKYVLKLRTDMILTANEFLDYFDRFTFRTDEYCMFEKKVVIADFYTRHTLRCGNGYIPTPFHVSDWFFFGLTEDIKTYFMETREMTEIEQVGFRNIKRPELREKYDYNWYWRFPPEQFYGIQAVERHFPDIHMYDWSDWDEHTLAQSEKFIMNNFVILDFTRHGINLPKYEMIITSNCGERRYYEIGLYTFKIYEEIYNAMKNGMGIPEIWDKETDDWMFRKEENIDD